MVSAEQLSQVFGTMKSLSLTAVKRVVTASRFEGLKVVVDQIISGRT